MSLGRISKTGGIATEEIKFGIEDREFHFQYDPGRRFFEVKSVPRPYSGTWIEEESPHEIVNGLMAKNPGNVLFIDENVYGIHAPHLRVQESRVLRAPATEEFKTLEGVTGLIEFLQKNNFTKGETLVVVGGGIIQDVGAFAGACYKRGIRWVYVPTTLLSMCDSCIGSKAGINHGKAKNQLALFSAPAEVLINPAFIETLKYKDIKAGLGEILKLHVTGGRKALESYRRFIGGALALDYGSFRPLIFGALGVKRAVIEVDEFEFNYRKALNYGHTFGHAIEVLSDYRIPHGQAVVIGMVIANEISRRRSMLPEDECIFLRDLCFELLEPGIMKGIAVSKLEDLLRKDKKTLGGTATLVVPQAIGDLRLLPVELTPSFMQEIADIVAGAFGGF